MQSTEKINYNAFGDDNANNVAQPTPGLKESLAKKSRFLRPEDNLPKRTKEDFDKEVSQHQKSEMEIRNQAAEMAMKFKSLLKDRTVLENKSPLKKDFEEQVIRQLCDVGLKLNNDPNQPEGIGSIGILNLMMHAILIQRDTINNLSHKVSKMHIALETIIKAIEDDENDKKVE